MPGWKTEGLGHLDVPLNSMLVECYRCCQLSYIALRIECHGGVNLLYIKVDVYVIWSAVFRALPCRFEGRQKLYIQGKENILEKAMAYVGSDLIKNFGLVVMLVIPES